MLEGAEYSALSPLDGRYAAVAQPLRDFMSEGALIRERIRIEVEWMLFLWKRGIFGLALPTVREEKLLRSFICEASDYLPYIKEIEKTTQHDLKAVEIFLREKLKEKGLGGAVELVHFGCTSEDINNLAYALNIKSALEQVILPAMSSLIKHLDGMSRKYANQAMLAHTHGQPATPTTLGKELAVFAYRLKRQHNNLQNTEFLGKFSGATGTFSAHCVAAPAYPWQEWAKQFVSEFGLIYNPLTTQIESHDWLCELLGSLSHSCRILHNLATDMWSYISLGYFQQSCDGGSVGSSTMPHKVNPIRFENAEANLEIACGMISCILPGLATSRLQRDLSDSSIQRNTGVALGHTLVALDNLKRGLDSVQPNTGRLQEDLDSNWEVLAEAVQTVLRAEILAGNSRERNPYDNLKSFTRNRVVTKETLSEFIAGLEIGDDAKKRLLALTPCQYTGLAGLLVKALDDV